MKIFINDEEFEVFDNDDDITILERYSLKFADSNPSLPSYFRVTNKDFILKKGLKLQVEDVRDLISEMKQHDLIDESIIQDIKSKYPRLLKRMIGFLWIISHGGTTNLGTTGKEPKKGKEEIKLENFKPLDRYAFSTMSKTRTSVSEFKNEVEKFNKLGKERIEKERRIFSSLNKIKPVPVEKFDLEEISIEIGLSLDNSENILDVFDAMKTSENIPFIALVYKKKRFFKVFTMGRLPEDSWVTSIERESQGLNREGIFFKILNMPTSKISSKKILPENLYADGYWSLENNIYFTFKVRDPGAEDKIRDKIFGMFSTDDGESTSPSTSLRWNIISSRQIGIKGTFTVKNFNLERYIFADLIATNDLFKRFLYLDERSGGITGKIKTVMTKSRLFIHYSSTTSSSLGITITPIVTTASAILSIRISGARNFQQANAVANTFSKLLALYNSKKEGIKNIYETTIPSLKNKKAKIKKAKEDTKSGKRLTALSAFNEDLFRKRYGDQCQRNQQPVIITKEDADAAVQKFVKAGMDPVSATHKVMFFDGSYYICDPREPDDKDMRHLWPGLKVNKNKTIPGYSDDHPLLPCCYTIDQYKKKAGALKQYMEENSDATTNEGKKSKRDGAMEHILGPNKSAPPGRYGKMSFNWEKIFKQLGIEKIVQGRKGKKREFYPVLRYGVLQSPDSFFHCLEKAFNPKYSDLSNKAKIKKVMDVRTKISDYGKTDVEFSAAKQELFDYTNQTIEEVLLDKDRYMAPEIFIALAEKYYKCKIFLYEISSSRCPNGNIVVPRYSQAFLSGSESDDKKPVVLIVKYEIQGKDIPYQCDLVSFLVSDEEDDNGISKIKNIKYTFTGTSPIGDVAKKMFYETNEVFIVSPDGYQPYNPILGEE